jgi:hypothetical protein
VAQLQPEPTLEPPEFAGQATAVQFSEPQVYPASRRQALEQPSPAPILESSHSSSLLIFKTFTTPQKKAIAGTLITTSFGLKQQAIVKLLKQLLTELIAKMKNKNNFKEQRHTYLFVF